MAAGDNTPAAGNEKKVLQTDDPSKELSTSIVLSGAENFTDGNIHTGIAVVVSSDGKPSTLVIPDLTKVTDGAPVYITKPVRIDGKNLKEFLKNKGVTLPAAVTNLIEDTKISCEAFYYSNGPLLMMFAIKFEKGLIESLTGDKDLGALFDIQGASVRVLRCPEKSFDVLKKYVAGLEA